MKKLFILFTVALMAIGASAQISLLKVSYEGGVEPNWWPEGNNPLIVEPTPEGLALSHPEQWDEEQYMSQYWLSQMVVTDDCLTFQKKHNYLVRLTVKVPHNLHSSGRDGGTYTVRLGSDSWGRWYQRDVIVSGGDDFQVIDVEFPDFPHDVDGDGHVIFRSAGVVGTTILKEVEVFDNTQEGDMPELSFVYEKDWSGVEYSVSDAEENLWEATDDGLAITNPQMQENIWDPMTIIAYDFSLEQGHDYIVRLTMKAPSDGTYQVNMGSGSTNYLCKVPVTASEDFQMVVFEFPKFAEDAEYVLGLEGGCHVILQSGWVVGTTIVKKVEVIENVGYSARGNTTGIKAAKASKADDVMYNLAGQRVDASYKGVVIQNGKKHIMR